MTPARAALAVALVAGLGFAGTRILATAGADPVDAGASPTDILAARPLAGAAFADLARAETDPAKKLDLHHIAVRRAPRDLEVRAWLFEHYLAAGETVTAMEHLDVILRLGSADMRDALVPAVVQLSADPVFAETLVAALAQEPTWRRAVLDALRKDLAAPGSATVFAALRERGALTETEAGSWLDALIRDGRWGEAYSLWVSDLEREPGESIPMLWDGRFDREPSSHGFGWRIGNSPGSYVQFEEAAGAQGRAARMVFLGRSVATGNLEQPLHLAPGRYRIRMRLMGEALRSDQGLHWEVACGGRGPRFRGEPVNGGFGWRDYALAFDIPVTGCPGQWLRLRNPAPEGSARIVSGELWVDDVVLEVGDST